MHAHHCLLGKNGAKKRKNMSTILNIAGLYLFLASNPPARDQDLARVENKTRHYLADVM
jgi:hypothetical protein